MINKMASKTTEEITEEKNSAIIPCLRYRDAVVAIEWLCEVIGLSKHLVVPQDDGRIAHAQLTLGRSMIMLGSANKDINDNNAYGQLIKQPDELGGTQTQSAYIVVRDADAIYAKAIKAGARIAIDIKDEEYGGRGFSFFDLEGHLWSIGTYDPWQI
ncbi:glyoxalase [Undibacterium sp. RTI2.1]|uniref:VOC family protein n=1 Tax=unclassified Undibacterium TaxID=2630295 RepID=UPI002B238C7C|nr:MULTISPECIES: VOC family protein [unclassified Undibacterium]MEB0032279.1 glyoxalase [Undibacterium sp. RTI2.1]MEB0118415.1 glyoxalase [Undibacterium sp. RTI2.2]